jgi:AraC-like DNA-binding protein
MELYFGWRTAVLFCAMLVTAPIIIGLSQSTLNHTANRTLALLLLVLVGVITPWMIGFAGFYDRWPWLTFLPVAMPLFVPPLALFYAHALMHGAWPDKARLALLPGGVHFGIMLAGFVLPSPHKQQVVEAIGLWINAAVALSLVIGFVMALVRLRQSFAAYAQWLGEQRSDDARFATRWLSCAITALALLFAVWAAFEVTDILHPLGYAGLMPLYLAIAGTMVFLAIEGWRHGGMAWPVMQSRVPAAAHPAVATGHDWAALGARWRTALQEGEYNRELDPTLVRAARLLGTNTAYLSRGCNEGLGLSFSTVINHLRAEAVAEAIAQRPDAGLLDLALEAGFASKASFNRAFAERYGTSPSAWRRRLTS